MLGGHQAKAMPERILTDPRLPRIDALILGEGEYRVAALLADRHRRQTLPGVHWRTPSGEIARGEV
jgi:anaerobic magnesium-protoporphyrin IX monomethyl ester cyclase